MNKKMIIVFIVFLLLVGLFAQGLHAAPQPKTLAEGMFDQANELFREKKYEHAIERYQQILNLGLESGNLHYNIGNVYFKIGKLGEALSSYERARRLMPNDSDLKANINFLESLRKNPVLSNRSGWIVAVLEYLGGYFSIDRLTIIWVVIYWLLFIVSSAAVLMDQHRALFINYIVGIGIILILISSVWGVKVYDINAHQYAFIIDEVIDTKFAPTAEATTYFKVYEGTRVTLIREEGKWARIKTPDGKIGWVLRSALDKV